MTEWNATEYNRNSSLQAAMAHERLADLALEGNERILDVGCGDGKITAGIAARVARRAANARAKAHSTSKVPVAAKSAPPAATAASSTVTRTVISTSVVVGDLTLRARKYQSDQLAKGNRITTAEAVAHFSKT